MQQLQLDNLSPFGKLAVQLDNSFLELRKMSDQIQKLEINSDSGLEKAIRILTHFSEHGQTITEGIRQFAQTLQEARENSENAAKIVSEHASRVQFRKQELDSMQERIGTLGGKVKEVTKSLAATREPELLRAIEARLEDFIIESKKIQEDARAANMRELSRNAESLFGTLQSAKQKIGLLVLH